MQPLSRRRRRLYLYGLMAVFLLSLPVVMFYANGYRFKSGLGFVRTGSIIISVEGGNALITLNGEEVGTSGFLRHNFYVDNLLPGTYQILVTREGDHPWHRSVVVEQEVVTDVQAFLIPVDITSIHLVDSAKAPLSTTTTPHVTYESYRTAFLPSSATSTSILALHQPTGEILALENGDVFVRWIDVGALPPSRFCLAPSLCGREISIESGKPYAISAEFFGGGVVYGTKEGGVFLGEIDLRPEPLTVPLYPVRGAEFRIVGGHLIIKDGTALYEITGL